MNTIAQAALYSVLILSSLSCCGRKKQAGSVAAIASEASAATIAPLFDVSAATRRFIAKVEQEIKDQGGDAAAYVPSDALVEEFGLRSDAAGYAFGGFIRTTNDFDPASIERIGGSMGAQTMGLSTVTVPVKSIRPFFQTQGISYFEVATKAGNK